MAVIYEDPYIRFRKGERSSLVSRAEEGCRCGAFYILDPLDGSCLKCGHPASWSRFARFRKMSLMPFGKLQDDAQEALARDPEALGLGPEAAGLVDSRTVAEALGVSVPVVQKHAYKLGAKRLHTRKGARLMFDLEAAKAGYGRMKATASPNAGKILKRVGVDGRVFRTLQFKAAGEVRHVALGAVSAREARQQLHDMLASTPETVA
jgi:hypothetical protein